MAVIKKKTWPELFELIMSDKKKFDLRMADFEIKEGDTLILEEWNPDTGEYTGRRIEKIVEFVRKFHFNDFGQEEQIKEKGFYVIQF